MKSDEVSVRYTIVGGMLDLRLAMVEAHMFARLIGVFSVRQPASQQASHPASLLATQPPSHLASKPASHLATYPFGQPANQPAN